MQTLKNVFILCLFSLFHPHSALAADLKTYSEVYQKNSADIRQSYQPKFEDLQQQYGKSLETLKVRAQNQGDLKTTKAAIAEIDRFQKEKLLPSKPGDDEVPEIRAFQSAYVKQYSRLETELTSNLGALTAKYEQALDRLLKELTKAGKLDEATAVETEQVKAQRTIKDLAEQLAALKVPEVARDADNATSRAAGTPMARLGEKDENIEFAMALIPAGANIGSEPQSGNYSLAVPDPFYMDACEVSKNKWDTTYSWAIKKGYQFANPGKAKKPNHPVVHISWFDSVKWCNARSEQEGLKPCYTVGGAIYRTGESAPECNFAASGYRLPTQEEWRYAARGGLTGKRFPWGDTIQHSQSNYKGGTNDYDLSEVKGYHPAYCKGDEPYTSPVGSFLPNGYGLYDMAGNVMEYCWTPNGSNRIIEGGGWATGADWLRCDFGWVVRPAGTSGDDGFRTVRLAEEKNAAAAPSFPPPAAIRYGPNFYRLFEEKCSWEEAKERCEALGGHLACANSKAEHRFLGELARDLHVWLGATDLKKQGDWLWLDGSSVKVEAWQAGNPHKPGDLSDERYLIMFKGLWQDYPLRSGYQGGYICEWESPKGTKKTPLTSK